MILNYGAYSWLATALALQMCIPSSTLPYVPNDHYENNVQGYPPMPGQVTVDPAGGRYLLDLLHQVGGRPEALGICGPAAHRVRESPNTAVVHLRFLSNDTTAVPILAPTHDSSEGKKGMSARDHVRTPTTTISSREYQTYYDAEYDYQRDDERVSELGETTAAKLTSNEHQPATLHELFNPQGDAKREAVWEEMEAVWKEAGEKFPAIPEVERGNDTSKIGFPYFPDLEALDLPPRMYQNNNNGKSRLIAMDFTLLFGITIMLLDVALVKAHHRIDYLGTVMVYLMLAGVARFIPMANAAPADRDATLTETESLDILDPEGEVVSSSSLFKKTGILAGGVSFGHLLFTIDLNKMDAIFDNYDRTIERFTEAAKPLDETVVKHAKIITRKHNVRMASAKLQWSNYKAIFYERVRVKRDDLEEKPLDHEIPPYPNTNMAEAWENSSDQERNGTVLERQKRVIGLVLGIFGALSMLGTALGLFSLASLSQMDGQEKDKDGKEFIIEHLQDHESRISQLERQHNYTTKSIQQIHEEAYDNSVWRKIRPMEQYLDQYVALAEMEMHRRINGLDNVLHQRLSPQLINTTILEDGLQALADRAGKQDFQSPVSKLAQLYQLPTSFLGSETGIVNIFIHVPLVRTGSVLQLYEYLPMPIAIRNSYLSIQVEPETRLLAVNPEKTGMLLLDPETLESCYHIGELYICKNTNYLLRDFAAYCITNLFLGDTDQASKVCTTKVMPQRVVVMQTDAEEFFVFHPETMSLNIDCGSERIVNLKFKGTKKIHIRPGCYGHNSAYSLVAYKSFSLNFTVLERPNLWRPTKMLSDLTLEQIHTLLPTPPNQPVFVENLKQQYDAIQAAQFGRPWQTNLGLALSWPIVPILICVAILWLCKGRVSEKIHSYAPPPPAAPIVIGSQHQPNAPYYFPPTADRFGFQSPPTYPDLQPLRKALSLLSLVPGKMKRSLSKQSITSGLDTLKKSLSRQNLDRYLERIATGMKKAYGSKPKNTDEEGQESSQLPRTAREMYDMDQAALGRRQLQSDQQ